MGKYKAATIWDVGGTVAQLSNVDFTFPVIVTPLLRSAKVD